MNEREHVDLRAATLRGVRWTGAARLVAEVTTLVSAVVLARIIPPAEFGRAAVALIVVALAVIVGPAGLTAPLVQRREVDRPAIQSAAFLSLASGLLLTLLTIGASPLSRAAFGDRTADMLLLASPAWALAGIGAVSQAMLQRELRFERLAFVDSTTVVGGAVAAVGLALLGLDAPALIVGALVGMAIGSISAVVTSPPPSPRPSRRPLLEIGSFALPVALSSLAYSAFRNVDYAILGARMSPANVGFYWRAYQLGVEYQGKLSQIMLRVSFPVFSRAETLDELRRLRLRIVRVHATVLVPLLGLFVPLAPVAIPAVFGPTWEPAVLPAQIMAVAGVAHALVTGIGPLLVSLGRPGILLAWNLGELVAYAAMIFVLAPHGLVAVSIGVAAFAVLGFFLTQVVLLRPLLELPLGAALGEVVPGVVAAACVIGAAWPARAALESTGTGSAAILISCLALAGAVYVFVLRTFFRPIWLDLLSIARRTARPAQSAAVHQAAAPP